MTTTRSMKLLTLATNQPLIFLPKWETTKGTTSVQQRLAIEGWNSIALNLSSTTTTTTTTATTPTTPPTTTTTTTTTPPTTPPPTTTTNEDELLSTTSKTSSEPFSPSNSEYLPSSPDELVQISDNSSDDSNHSITTQQQEPCEKDITLKNKQKLKQIRNPDFCYYCETDVLNFARHIKRNHISELEVSKIFSLQTNSKERKDLIANLRKRGNFIKNSETCSKPVRNSNLDHSLQKYVPCKHCLGFYSSKQLWRHVRSCKLNGSNSKHTTFSHLSDAQNVMLQGIKVDKELAETVFPRMIADKISLVAKKDALICMFGSRYLKCHREKHLVNVCSRKMRELSRLLISMTEAQPSIKTLFQALQPQNFDLIVECVKKVSKFDTTKDSYKSPSYAMNIHSTLKQCCDIAILNVLKRKSIAYTTSAAEAETDFKTMKQLLQDSWCFEISKKAAADLNTKKWNKISIIPLATDLRIFKTYLEKKSNEAYLELHQNQNDAKAYQTLMETIFCRLLLLNRKRVGELQRLPLQIYTETGSVQNYEEFSEAVTPTEKILLKHFKRIVIRGKRGRGVPVLFSSELQQHTQKLIDLRENFVDSHNIYLFANLKTRGPVTGYKVLNKYASSSGAKNPTALTSTRLRKHLATISQLFSMSGNEIEQLATFMGHTSEVHKQVYRLPDDVYQTAKISKLLLLMEKGQASEYKGKTLDEIDVNLDIELDDADADTNDNIEEAGSSVPPLNEVLPSNTSANKTGLAKSKKLKRKPVPWTNEQRERTIHFFNKHIKTKKPPKRHEVEEFKSKTGNLLENKSWTQVKAFVQHQYTKK